MKQVSLAIVIFLYVIACFFLGTQMVSASPVEKSGIVGERINPGVIDTADPNQPTAIEEHDYGFFGSRAQKIQMIKRDIDLLRGIVKKFGNSEAINLLLNSIRIYNSSVEKYNFYSGFFPWQKFEGRTNKPPVRFEAVSEEDYLTDSERNASGTGTEQ